jgi:AcrR family transcriptional regulator
MTKTDDRVLGVAGRLFRERGFAATTVREIAAEAGMLPGSLHYRFPTKDALLLALMDRGMRHAMEVVRGAVETGSDPLDRMRRGLAAHLRLLVESDDAIYVNLYELRSVRGEDRARIVALRDAYESLWDGLLHQAVGAGLVRPGTDLTMVRLLLLGAINWSAQWYDPRAGRTPEAVAESFLTLAGFGFLEPAARTDSEVAADDSRQHGARRKR